MTWYERWLERARAVNPTVSDSLLALVCAVIAVPTMFTQDLVDDMREPGAVALLLTLGVCATVCIRRRHPLLAMSLGAPLLMAMLLAKWPEGVVPIVYLVLTYSAAAWSDTRRAAIGLALVYVTLLVLGIADTPGLDAQGLVSNVTLFTTAWVIGLAVKLRREAVDARLRRSEELALVEVQRAATAVAEERLRIAQELHDVVAHSMSVIAVQAGVGAHVLDDQPEQARQALEAISQTSRGTLQEMRRLLGVLRGDDGERSHTPAPTLNDVDRLVDDVRAAGMPIELEVEGRPTALHSGVDLSAYRIVQEALTNVLKHSGQPSRVDVRVRYGPDEVTVEVVDDGRGLSAQSTGSGHGLLGMRERVELWGGELTTGPRPGGGFRVEARLPYSEPA